MEFKETYVWVLGSILTCGALLPVFAVRAIYVIWKQHNPH